MIVAQPERAHEGEERIGKLRSLAAAQIAAFDPVEGRGIVVPTHHGKRGNPVLWARAYFPEIARVTGDQGARHLLSEFAEAVVEVELGQSVLTDIDTPEALAAFANRA